MSQDYPIAAAIGKAWRWLYIFFQGGLLLLSIAKAGDVAYWAWYEVLWPTWISLGLIVLCLIPILLKLVIIKVSERKRDPYHTFEPLRRFRAWRWKKSQQKYNPEKEN